MKHSTLALCFILTVLVAVALGAPTQAATVGIYANGFLSHVGGDQGCLAPTVDLVIQDLQEPLKAIEFSLEVSEGLTKYLYPISVAGGSVTQDGNNVSIRFDNCLNPTDSYRVCLFVIWYGEDADQTICVRPPSAGTMDPPAVSYETCDGQLRSMDLAIVGYDGISDGCLLISKMVPVAESTWGTLKTWY